MLVTHFCLDYNKGGEGGRATRGGGCGEFTRFSGGRSL